MGKRSASPRRSALASGVLTALSLAVVTGLSAVVGVVIARHFGRGPETDGFFAAYSVFLVLVLVGTALRVAVIPPLTRARLGGDFERELGSYAAAIAVVAAPALVLALAAPELGARLLAAGLPPEALEVAADTLRFVVPAAVAQIYGALAASALAAHDSYGTAAAAYAVGSASGLALILLLVGEHGILACAWGMLLTGSVVLAVTGTGLVVRMGVRRLRVEGIRRRLRELARSTALPLVLQLLFVLCLRQAAGLGTGAVTSFTYAYLVAAGLVAVTASSLGLVSSAPLSRGEAGAARLAEHVVRTSWLAFAAVAAAAGIFALVGADVVAAVLGGAYGGDVGEELGRLVALLGPWMALSVGVTITFPLLFVARRDRRLPLVAAASLALHLPLAWLAVREWGLGGGVLALTVTTGAILIALLALLPAGVLAPTLRGLALGALATGGGALAAFGGAQLVLPSTLAAAVGLVAFAALLALLRPLGLRKAWAYARALE